VTEISVESRNVFWDLVASNTAYDPETNITGDAAMGLWGKIPHGLVLLGFLIVGAILIFVPHFSEWKSDYGIVPEIGVALVISAILGFTIDRWLKAELRTDAFLAAIGHILAPEFREEVSRIIGMLLPGNQRLSIVSWKLAAK
jgi:hypothetical protein